MSALTGHFWQMAQGGILRSASWLVPQESRAEWLREWSAELWHARDAATVDGLCSLAEEKALLPFCLGAYKDAVCLRRMQPKKTAPVVLFRGSAAQCLVSLGALLGVCMLVARLLPGVHATENPELYRMKPGLVLIQNSSRQDDSLPTVSARLFETWRTRPQKYFDGLAFYQVQREAVSGDAMNTARWKVAHATANLFGLLGLRVLEDGEVFAHGDLPKLIVSERAWKRDFGGRIDVLGSVMRVGGRDVRVAGVLPVGTWRLPGEADAWLLDPGNVRGVGFVVAHLTGLGRKEMRSEREEIAAYETEDLNEDLWAISFHERTRGPLGLYLFALFLAFLSLPAITSVSLDEYSFCTHKPSWKRRLCRWSFLATKTALVLPIGYFLSLDVAYARVGGYSAMAENVQLFAAFVICLFGLRWVLLDQRQRCPVCLRRVTHPAQVGQASRMFLAWNGTELMCSSGHTLLHVPGLPTSWFSTQRWLYLDGSWEFLFVGSRAS